MYPTSFRAELSASLLRKIARDAEFSADEAERAWGDWMAADRTDAEVAILDALARPFRSLLGGERMGVESGVAS
jgi:hypothetical protein